MARTKIQWIDKAEAYIKRIKNSRKRLYASAYFGYLQGKRGEPRAKDYAVGAMTAQAVRNSLYEIKKA